MPYRFPRFTPLTVMSAAALSLALPDASAGTSESSESPSTNPSGFEQWWDGKSALPENDVRIEDTFRHRKFHHANGSVIPRSDLRQDMADAGISFMGAFTAYFMGNVSGGMTQDFAYNHMLFLVLRET